MTKNISIIGAGSWGTAIAVHLAHCGNRVLLWAHSEAHVLLMQEEQANNKYLPSIAFPKGIEISSDINHCVEQSDYVLIATPSHAFSEVLSKIEKPITSLAWLTKGLDPIRHCVLSDLVLERYGQDFPIAMISGPSFATEVANHLPTALTLAGNDLIFQKQLQTLLHKNNMRVYLSNDLIGVQLCAAVKNVLAIATGISDGLGYGANARAALVTRGLAEMARLGRKFGAREETFSGLAGIGDLMLTCTDNQSRNRRFGMKLGYGLKASIAEAEIGQVVEGKYNASQIAILAHKHGVEMPICEQVEALLNEKVTLEEAVMNLMGRMAGDEFRS